MKIYYKDEMKGREDIIKIGQKEEEEANIENSKEKMKEAKLIKMKERIIKLS
jgi:hypothetical protein